MEIFELIFFTAFGVLTAFYLAYYGLMLYYTKRTRPWKKQPIFPQTTLVICTYNEGDTIRPKLENIRELHYPKDKLEVLIVDSASVDNTQLVINKFINENPDLNLKLITQSERFGKAAALNHAWNFCNGEIVVISDADSIMEKTALNEMIANFADPSVGAVTGKQILLNPRQSTATKSEQNYRNLYEIIRMGESHLDSTPIFHGELSAFRRDLIEPISNNSAADDSELAIRVRAKGYRAIYDRDAIFYEFAPPSLVARIKQKGRRGVGLIQQFIRFRHLMFNRKNGKYGIVILPSEFFMHIISPILVATLAISLIFISLTIPTMIPLILLSCISPIIVGFALSRLAVPQQRVNPLFALVAFLGSQLCLIPSMFSLLTRRKIYKWNKIESIRMLWAMKPRFRTVRPQQEGKLKEVSIGICAYNEGENIGRLLKTLTLFSPNLPPNFHLKEIVVVASGCTDNTVQLVEEFKSNSPLVKLVVENERTGKAAAANVLMDNVTGEILVMESADTIPTAYTLRELLKPFEDRNVIVTTAHPVPINNPETLWGYAAYLIWNLHHDLCVKKSVKLTGELYALRRDYLPIIPKNVIDEDAYVEIALKNEKIPVVYTPNAIVHMRGPDNLKDFIRQRKRISMGYLQIKQTISYVMPSSDPYVVFPLLTNHIPSNLKKVLWLCTIILTEVISRTLAKIDFMRGKVSFIWNVSPSTKKLTEELTKLPTLEVPEEIYVKPK